MSQSKTFHSSFAFYWFLFFLDLANTFCSHFSYLISPNLKDFYIKKKCVLISNWIFISFFYLICKIQFNCMIFCYFSMQYNLIILTERSNNKKFRFFFGRCSSFAFPWRRNCISNIISFIFQLAKENDFIHIYFLFFTF